MSLPPSARSVLSARPPFALALLATLTALTTASAAPAPEPAFPAAAKLETDNYQVEISAPGPFKAGAQGTAKVTLTAKGAYHINPKYPYKFKASEPPSGLSYPKPVLQRADGQFEEKRAVFSLGFVASQAGQFNVGGAFHMSVCSADNCLIDKPSLTVTVNVQ